MPPFFASFLLCELRIGIRCIEGVLTCFGLDVGTFQILFYIENREVDESFISLGRHMDYEEYNTFCRALPATTYVVQWGGSHVWKVGGKIFAVGGWSKNNVPAFTFKTSELNFHILSDQPGFRPAPYLASRGMMWIQKDSQPGEKDRELEDYLRDSHRLVSLGLTKKKQKELGLNQNLNAKSG